MYENWCAALGQCILIQ